MPIFSYVCKDCNEKFDLFLQVRKADNKLLCVKCGSENIQRIFSSFSIGSGLSPDNDSQQISCPTGTCPF